VQLALLTLSGEPGYPSVLTAPYSDDAAADPRIDALREKMTVSENPRFTRDYFDPDKRAIGNSVQVTFIDGTATETISVDYPVGHRRRRSEGVPLLEEKFERAVAGHFPARQRERILAALAQLERTANLTVPDFTDLWVL